MNTFQQHIFPLLICLIASVSLFANNPTDSLTLEEIQSLPIEPIEFEAPPLSDRFVTTSEKPVDNRRQTLLNNLKNNISFDLPNLDLLVNEQLKKAQDNDKASIINPSSNIIIDDFAVNDQFTHMSGYDFKNDQEVTKVKKAKKLINSIIATGNFVKNIVTNDLISLPVGVKTTINNVQIIFGVNAVELHP